MSAHPNSAECYYHARADGTFGKRHAVILAAMRKAGVPLTDRGVMLRCGFSDPNAVRPRITELIEAGVLQEVDRVVCPITRVQVRTVKIAPKQTEFSL